jgi:hypothetical protein
VAGRADVTFAFGAAGAGWLPIVGDWNGDGTDTVGLYNAKLGKFFLKNSHAGGAADVSFVYGAANAGWLPIAGDWNGDGTDTVALHNPALGKFFLKNSHAGGAADVSFVYGAANAGWLPIAGDWNGDGTDSIGLYKPSASTFYLRNSHTAGPANVSFSYGPAGAGWRPVTGDWNGASSGANNVAIAGPDRPPEYRPAIPPSSRAAPGGPDSAAESRVAQTMTGRDQAIRGTDLITALFEADYSSDSPVANRLSRGARRLPSAVVDQVHAELFDWSASNAFLN